MIRCEEIIDKVLTYLPNANQGIIRKAYVFSARAHKDQLRASGEPYLSHSLEVASILADMKMDVDTIAAGILHDTIEDTPVTLQDIETMFNPTIALLVDGVTKIGKIKYKSIEEKQSENFRKMLMAMAKDIRVILIKLADRLHNMRTLEYLNEEKRKFIAQETLDIYAPIAHRLGMGEIKWELEDESLRYLQPDVYYTIAKKVRNKRRERLKYIEEVRNLIQQHLIETGLDVIVEGRPKHFYSIYQKMMRRRISFDEVYDLLAFRIITDTIKDCYASLGAIHSLWTPVPGRFKDYIAMPKPNMYQSLHTTVIGPKGNRIEIQIRTKKMHEVAERGIAAHWLYKEGTEITAIHPDEFKWIKQILSWQEEMKDPKEYMKNLKVDLTATEVYVFTPKGEVKSFPRGATVVDFAYAIHTHIGHKCSGARVNGKMVPLKYQLKSGDVVEIITSENHKPSRDWLNFVITSRAQNKIKLFLREEESGKSYNLGKTLIEKALKKNNINLSKVIEDEAFKNACSSLGYPTLESLFIAVGFGKLSAETFIKKYLPESKNEVQKAKGLEKIKEKFRQVVRRNESTGIRIKDIDNILIRFAKCCSPVPGDEIKGFITRGRGVTIHKADCALLNKIDINPERRIDVEWDSKAKTERPVKISVTSENKKGMLASISSIIASNDIDIVSANAAANDDGTGDMTFIIQVKNVDQLNKAITQINNLKGVIKIERVGLSEKKVNVGGG
ncbi:MAG: bifunctional (p)ppGpp synthetase/guanosine-3',5'-bis(diphosphate) 3'-pyrophosphohydrolase [Candidatus Schekmanbacteria bacterium]|nr:MAG: bifunctional (p)ppGpp synthetase/guanosine-3',5'-bis(diphosphate) 3'-pyrophosphohydrolase [Candidatus Schekmanbacteria bacterium]